MPSNVEGVVMVDAFYETLLFRNRVESNALLEWCDYLEKEVNTKSIPRS